MVENCGLDSYVIGQKLVVIFCAYGDEPSGSIKYSLSGRAVTWILFVYWLVSWIASFPRFLCH
jgi:hypothetical protein